MASFTTGTRPILLKKIYWNVFNDIFIYSLNKIGLPSFSSQFENKRRTILLYSTWILWNQFLNIIIKILTVKYLLHMEDKVLDDIIPHIYVDKRLHYYYFWVFSRKLPRKSVEFRVVHMQDQWLFHKNIYIHVEVIFLQIDNQDISILHLQYGLFWTIFWCNGCGRLKIKFQWKVCFLKLNYWRFSFVFKVAVVYHLQVSISALDFKLRRLFSSTSELRRRIGS